MIRIWTHFPVRFCIPRKSLAWIEKVKLMIRPVLDKTNLILIVMQTGNTL